MTAERVPECERCRDTGNDPSTGWEHPGYDELGCPRCPVVAGERLCCTAEPRPFQELLRAGFCRNCGHSIRLTPDTHERPGAEPSGVAGTRSADAPPAGSSDGGSPETERAIGGSPSTPGRNALPVSAPRRRALSPARDRARPRVAATGDPRQPGLQPG